MTGGELLALADRVQRLSGPDREVDALIRCAVLAPPGSYVRQSQFNGAWCIYAGKKPSGAPLLWEPFGLSRHEREGEYTASVDAALTLVPDGCWVEGSLGNPASIEVHAPMTFDPLGRSTANNPARSITAACLRALATPINTVEEGES